MTDNMLRVEKMKKNENSGQTDVKRGRQNSIRDRKKERKKRKQQLEKTEERQPKPGWPRA